MIRAEYYDKLASIESSNNPLAQNPASSAKGKFQFIDSTAKQYGLDKFKFGTPEYKKAEERAARKLTQDNFNYLKSKLNRPPTNGELYLAHQQGASGAEKILKAPQDAKAVDVLGMDEVKNNGGDENMTVAEFSQKWMSKFDDLDAQEKGLTSGEDQETLMGDQGKDTLEVDAFADFGVTISDNTPDAFSDFGVKADDEFMLTGDMQKSMIDQSSGAPSYIRQVVGTFYDPESRLATLQKYYPDAQPYGDDNFVFTNPETGKPTLYNPKGIDTGDVSSLTKEAFVATGSAMGAFVGGGAGTLASAPTVGLVAPATTAAGVVVGAGLGAGIASNVFDAWMTLTGQTRDVRTAREVATETAIEVIGAGLGEGIGRQIPVVAKKAIGGAKETSRQIVEQFERLGIRPTLTTTGKATAGRIEAGLSQNVMSVEIMQKQADDVVKQSQAALIKIAEKFGKPKTKQGAGQAIIEAAEAAVDRITNTTTNLYGKAYDLVGETTPVDLQAVKQLHDDLMIELARSPETKKRTFAPALNTLKAMLADSQNTGIDFQTLRSIRTDIGRDLADPLSSGATSSQNLAMKRVYAALSDDMGRTALEAGDDAASAIARADKYRKAYAETAEKTLKKILKYDAEEKAYKFALTASRDGGTSLIKLRKLFKNDEWDDVAATVLSQLGDNPATGEFSISKFVTGYNKLAPEAKDALFRGGRYKDASRALDDFVDLMSKLKDTSRYQNTSNTAGALQFNLMVQGLGLAGGGFLAGEQTSLGGVSGAIGAVIAPRMAAKLVTNPKFVKWLSLPVTEGAQNMSAYLTKLVVLGETNPEIKDGVEQLIKVMKQNTSD